MIDRQEVEALYMHMYTKISMLTCETFLSL